MSALAAEPLADGRAVEHARDRTISSQFVTFRAGATAYGVDIMTVREIRSWSHTAELPGRDRAARGVLDIRGQVVEVFDLAVALGGEPSRKSAEQVIIVVSLDQGEVGLLVDSVSDIIFVAKKDLLDPPGAGMATGGQHITHMINQGDNLIAALDVAALFGDGGRSGA